MIWNYEKRACTHIETGVETVYLLDDSKEKSEIAAKIAINMQEKYAKIKSVKNYAYTRKRTSGKIGKGTCIAINTYEAPDYE